MENLVGEDFFPGNATYYIEITYRVSALIILVLKLFDFLLARQVSDLTDLLRQKVDLHKVLCSCGLFAKSYWIDIVSTNDDILEIS